MASDGRDPFDPGRTATPAAPDPAAPAAGPLDDEHARPAMSTPTPGAEEAPGGATGFAPAEAWPFGFGPQPPSSGSPFSGGRRAPDRAAPPAPPTPLAPPAAHEAPPAEPPRERAPGVPVQASDAPHDAGATAVMVEPPPWAGQQPVAATRPQTSFDAWRASDGFAPPPDSSSLPRYHLAPETSTIPSLAAPTPPRAPVAPPDAEASARAPTGAQLLLGAGLLVSLLLAIYPVARRVGAEGAVERARAAKSYVDAELEKASRERERLDEEELRKYENDLARTQQSEYERRQAVEYERERRKKSRAETAQHLREELGKELELRDLEREALDARGPHTLGAPLLVALVLSLAALVAGSLALTLRARGAGRRACAAVLLVGLTAAGVGVAGGSGLPALETGGSGPTPATPRRPPPGPRPESDDALCARLFALLPTRDTPVAKDDFIASCKRELARSSPEARACFARARTLDDLVECGKKEKR
ncbi:MAG: hypothetical protein HY908_08320 [Myxococcales bacterium]|nr:hypothetical protein [Myxococcales bacterium]